MASLAACHVATPAVTVRASAFNGQALGSLRPAVAARPVRSSRMVVRAASEEVSGTQKQLLEAVETAKEKWDKVENKPTVLLYAGGAVLALWITSSVLGSLDRIPLVPDFLKLVGTVYSGWFVYRYLLFESSRKELKEVVNDLKAKITEK